MHYYYHLAYKKFLFALKSKIIHHIRTFVLQVTANKKHIEILDDMLNEKETDMERLLLATTQAIDGKTKHA
jgi:hypothetical protein